MSNNRIEAFTLVDRAIRLLLGDEVTELREVESCLLRALELDPKSVEVLQEAAHFYDTAIPNPERARAYAVACREKASAIIAEMDEILEQK